MRRTIFFVFVFLIVLGGIALLVYRVVDWQKILMGVAALFPFGQALQKKLAEIDDEFAKRKIDEEKFQAQMSSERMTLETEVRRLEKEIAIIEKKYDLLEKRRSTIREAIDQMPDDKKVQLFREAFGE